MRPAAAFFLMAPGRLAQFNDGTVDGPSAVAAEAPRALAQAGYWRLEAGTARLIVDCGRCCPDDLPAHAHADTLSFELYDGGRPLIVNCGTYAYQDEEWRNRFRGTALHSTLQVDDGDSAEVYGAFRLGRRPRRCAASVTGGSFIGEFDGWERLGLVHGRRLDLSGTGLAGCDEVRRLTPGPAHRLTARFHLHPSVVAAPEGEAIILAGPEGAAWRFTAAAGEVSLQPSWYAPRFHDKAPTQAIRLCADLAADPAVLRWRFERMA
jgi:uncharacterized heparinase superfamily protein